MIPGARDPGGGCLPSESSTTYMDEVAVNDRALTDKVEIALSGDQEGVEAALARAPLPRFIDCVHRKPDSWTSLIHLAQKDEVAFRVLITLAKNGYIIYRAPAIGTSLVHRRSLREVWKPLREGEYQQTADGTVYKFTSARHSGPPTSLVVVFSSVAKNRFTQYVERHVGSPFSSLDRSVSGHTAVLRIADIDGVVGAYYLPTTRDPQAAQHIQNLIEHVAENMGLGADQIVTYGVSKGGTGALYHGLLLESHTVAVDPIVTLNRRNTRATDPYFSSSSLYTEPFDDTFRRLLLAQELPERNSRNPEANHVVITSVRSKEYPDIMDLVGNSDQSSIAVVESLDPHIQHHHEVGPNTVPLSLSFINLFAQGIKLGLPSYSYAR